MYRKVKLYKPNLKYDYTIDTLGVVTNLFTAKPLKGTSITKNNRYTKIHLDKFYPLHRLVAEHFIPNPEGLPQVNHIDGNRHNNIVDNLEWCCSRDNIKHAYATGLKTNKGEVNPFSKLTKTDVAAIWALRHTELTARQIRDSLKLTVGISTVKSIRSGKNWEWFTSTLV